MALIPPSPLYPIRTRRTSTRDIAYEALKAAILDGRLASGEAIIEERLAEQLQVSRTPLREALQRLESEELVIRRTNGRLLVAPLSRQQVEELFAVRALLEGLVARQATQRVTPEALARLRRITESIEQAARAGETEAVSLYGEQFHTELYHLSENSLATRLLNQLRDQIRRYRRIGPVEDPDRAARAAQEHRQLYELVAAGRAEEAETAMRSHIEASLAAVVRSLARLAEQGESRP